MNLCQEEFCSMKLVLITLPYAVHMKVHSYTSAPLNTQALAVTPARKPYIKNNDLQTDYESTILYFMINLYHSGTDLNHVYAIPLVTGRQFSTVNA
jgi:hypothetical protein